MTLRRYYNDPPEFDGCGRTVEGHGTEYSQCHSFYDQFYTNGNLKNSIDVDIDNCMLRFTVENKGNQTIDVDQFFNSVYVKIDGETVRSYDSKFIEYAMRSSSAQIPRGGRCAFVLNCHVRCINIKHHIEVTVHINKFDNLAVLNSTMEFCPTLSVDQKGVTMMKQLRYWCKPVFNGCYQTFWLPNGSTESYNYMSIYTKVTFDFVRIHPNRLNLGKQLMDIPFSSFDNQGSQGSLIKVHKFKYDFDVNDDSAIELKGANSNGEILLLFTNDTYRPIKEECKLDYVDVLVSSTKIERRYLRT